jgi:hypothetical protein
VIGKIPMEEHNEVVVDGRKKKPIENCLRRDDVYFFLGRSFLESEIYSKRKVEKLTTEKQQNQNTNI